MTDTIHRTLVPSPLGTLTLLATPAGLAAAEFDTPSRQALLAARLARWYPGATVVEEENSPITAARHWLERYFEGRFDRLVTPPLDVRGTAFELRVWDALRLIPLARTTSYGELAAELGRPTAARAVGNAVRRNPASLIIPCHRVVGSGGSLTGYGGGLEAKARLLAHEAGQQSLRIPVAGV